MNTLRRMYWLVFVLVFSISSTVVAQGDCPAIVQQALAATSTACEATGRNQACYGNIDLSAVPQEDVAEFNFTEPGDLVDVAGVQSLTLSPLDQAQDVWGVALLKLQANLPDTLPGQNVTFLLFGDVEIQNAVSSNVEDAGSPESAGLALPVTIDIPVPLIESFEENSNQMPQIVNAGTSAVADGRDASGMMVHVTLSDGRQGWLLSTMISVEGDIHSLPLMDLEAQAEVNTPPPTPKLAPMQAFYFQTGLNDAPCTEAPDSGILIQTPEGAGKIELVVNNAEITLGSTAYFQAQPGGEMTVAVIEGRGTIEAEGGTVNVPAGMYTTLPLDDDLNASGTPAEPQPYDLSTLQSLPISILPQQITIAPPLEVTPSVVQGGNPVPGAWTYTQSGAIVGGGCPPMLADAFAMTGVGFNSETVIVPEGDFNLQALYSVNSEESMEGWSFSDDGSGVYSMDMPVEGGSVHYEFRVLSPTSIEGETFIDVEGCTITLPFTMTPNAG